jgi:hypothetical protein
MSSATVGSFLAVVGFVVVILRVTYHEEEL